VGALHEEAGAEDVRHRAHLLFADLGHHQSDHRAVRRVDESTIAGR
jgi:hypothetical protein